MKNIFTLNSSENSNFESFFMFSTCSANEAIGIDLKMNSEFIGMVNYRLQLKHLLHITILFLTSYNTLKVTSNTTSFIHSRKTSLSH